MVQLIRRRSPLDAHAVRSFRIPCHQHVERALPGGSGGNQPRQLTFCVSKHAQTGNAGFLPVGKLRHGQAQEAAHNARLPDNQIMRQIRFRPALVQEDEICFTIR